MARLSCFLLFAGLAGSSFGQEKWCNKNYKKGSPIVPPGGRFLVPPTSPSTLLAFRCTPIYKPYIAEDAVSGAGFIVDTIVTHAQVRGARPIALEPTEEPLLVKISIGNNVLAVREVPVDATKFEIPFSLASLVPRKEPYTVACSATYVDHQEFITNASLSYLPNPSSRSITKFDSRTGGLWTKPFDGGTTTDYAPVFPLGFFTSFSDYLAKNLSILDDLKSRGPPWKRIDTVHPLPPYDDLSAFHMMLDKMDELGLRLMYEMQSSYKNLSGVEEEASRMKSRKSLLLWYTADEPDGLGDPFDEATLAYDKMYRIDGYHPVSSVLNCQDYEFEAYTAGTDIVMPDVYTIGINATHSVVWDTDCTPDFGDCGCDNCVGEFEDISRGVDQFGGRLQALGWERSKSVWTVPQAFGGDTYWSRIPSGKEWVIQSLLAVIHGALGIISWNDPTSGDIKAAATTVSQQLIPGLTRFVLDPDVVFATYIWQRLHLGEWSVGSRTLIVGVNLDGQTQNFPLIQLPGWKENTQPDVLYAVGATFDGTQLVWERSGLFFRRNECLCVAV